MEACEEKVKLIRAGREDAKLLWNMQLQSFAQLLERYNDMDTNPGNEPLEKTVMRLKQPFTYFYFIEFNSETVGALRVVDKKTVQIRKSALSLSCPPTETEELPRWPSCVQKSSMEKRPGN